MQPKITVPKIASEGTQCRSRLTLHVRFSMLPLEPLLSEMPQRLLGHCAGLHPEARFGVQGDGSGFEIWIPVGLRFPGCWGFECDRWAQPTTAQDDAGIANPHGMHPRSPWEKLIAKVHEGPSQAETILKQIQAWPGPDSLRPQEQDHTRKNQRLTGSVRTESRGSLPPTRAHTDTHPHAHTKTTHTPSRHEQGSAASTAGHHARNPSFVS